LIKGENLITIVIERVKNKKGISFLFLTLLILLERINKYHVLYIKFKLTKIIHKLGKNSISTFYSINSKFIFDTRNATKNVKKK